MSGKFKLLITTYLHETYHDDAHPVPSSVVAEFDTEEEAREAYDEITEDESHEFVSYWAIPLWKMGEVPKVADDAPSGEKPNPRKSHVRREA